MSLWLVQFQSGISPLAYHKLIMRRVTIAISLLLCFSGTAVAQAGLANLKSWVGKYPTHKTGKVTKHFFLAAQIRQPLLKLLSKSDYKLLTMEYGVETPIKQIGDYLVVKVCRPHNCSDEQAGFAINLKSGVIYVRMFASDNARWFSSKGIANDLPAEVTEYIEDFSAT